MRKYFFLIIVLPLFCLLSFSTSEIILEKTWVFENYNSTNKTMTYKQKAKFHKNKSGIQFLSNGKLKVKQNTSWCGTGERGEKINWEIVDGSWSISKDSIIIINHLLWGKNNTEKLKIIELSNKMLVVKSVN
jgi:hypothetical protein